jgi:hypothetical protein
MSSPPPEASPLDGLRQPVTYPAGFGGADPASAAPFVELPGEPGQAGLGPTADNDLDLLHRHLLDGSGTGPDTVTTQPGGVFAEAPE